MFVTIAGFHENEGGQWRASGEDEGNRILSDRAATFIKPVMRSMQQRTGWEHDILVYI
jgi:hypothetical protein